MADYKAIKGHTIQTVSGDPGTIVDGLIWYDSVARKVQGSKTAAGSWATGEALPAVMVKNAGAGIQTAAIVFGGLDADGVADESYTYDGTD